MRSYSYSGLHVQSNWPIPDLPKADPHQPHQLLLRPGDRLLRRRLNMLPPLRRAFRPSGEDSFLSRIPDIGGMQVTSGLLEIVLERKGNWPLLRPFVLGTGFAIAMYQLGMIPHHMSAVAIDGCAIAFSGPSGAGKSTAVAAILARYQAELVCEDVARLEYSASGRTDVYPGRQRIRLCKDAAAALGFGIDRPQRHDDKQLVPSPASGAARDKVPLRAIVVIRGDAGTRRTTFERIQGTEALQEIVANVYRLDIGSILLSHSRILEHCINIARTVPVFRLSRTSELTHLDADLELVVGRLQGEQLVAASLAPGIPRPHLQD